MSELQALALPLEGQVALIESEGLFDASAYVRDNSDITDFGASPLWHFCLHGWREFRTPSPGFNLWWYWVKHLGGNIAAPNPALHYAVLGKNQGLSLNASSGGFATSAEIASFNLASMALLCTLQVDAPTYARIATLLERLGAWDLAEIAADKAVGAAPGNADYLHRLGEVLMVRHSWGRACKMLAEAVHLAPSHADWHMQLGKAQMKMNRFAEAVDAFLQALHLRYEDVQLHYLLGLAYRKTGDIAAADASFQRAIGLETRGEVQQFGVGVLHQENGDWCEAAAAFANLASRRADGEAHYRHGFALEHCYRWEEALAVYRLALEEEARPVWYYRSGIVLERLGQYDAAAQAYARALQDCSAPSSDWHYRQGYALYCARDYQRACSAWLQVCEHDTGMSTQPLRSSLALRREILEKGGNAERYFRLGNSSERECDWQGAAVAYEAAVARCNDHRPSWYYRLGVTRLKAGWVRDACEAFIETRLFKRPSLVEANTSDAKQEFAEFTATLPLRRRVVMYESFSGQAMTCNPYAIFRHLLARPDYAEWLHIWAVKRCDSVPLAYRILPNVIVVEYESSLYRRYLATAEYLINNLWFPAYFTRREDQRYLNTWHGTPLKCLGKGVEGSFLAYKNTARNFLQATHLLSPNEHTSHMLFDSYDVAGLFSAQLAETGYPRVDAVQGNSELRRRLQKRLNLGADRPVVLYAPTWRGTVDLFDADVAAVLEVLHELTSRDYQLVFRGHHFVEQAILRHTLPVAVATADIDCCELLSIVDVLITDYSSILFDFLPTRRPILYYAYDLAEYQKVQGPLCFDLQGMPGRVCHDLANLQESLREQLIAQSPLDERYRAALARFCPHEDGQSSARAVAFFFEGAQAHRIALQQQRPLLFHVGTFAPNGITASALNLLTALDERGDVLAVTVDPWNLESFPDRREKLARLPRHARIQARAGHMVLTAEEQWLVERFNSRHEVDDVRIWPVLEAVYRREFHRLFGDTCFTAVIDFSGYNPFWSSLFAMGAGDALKLIYLHADMVEEQRVRYPALMTQFRLYHYFDALVSVSAARSASHRSVLAKAYDISPQRFRTCDNMLDASMVLARAREPLDADLESWLSSRNTFLAVGRLSPEKDHSKLINAFAMVVRECPGARLVIAGDGPLRRELMDLIDSHRLQNAVLLAGQRTNPFPLLAHCACCVLSSNYEGQPMVLLEAMVLQRPIIATDIEANRAMLRDAYGVLAPNSEAGLAQAMSEFLRNGQTVLRFDADIYRQKALAGFDRLLSRECVGA